MTKQNNVNKINRKNFLMGQDSLKPATNCTSRTVGTQRGKLVYLLKKNSKYYPPDNCTLFLATEKRAIIQRLLYYRICVLVWHLNFSSTQCSIAGNFCLASTLCWLLQVFLPRLQPSICHQVMGKNTQRLLP